MRSGRRSGWDRVAAAAAAALCAAAIGVAGSPARAAAPPPFVDVDVRATGEDLSYSEGEPVVSGNGRFVAFATAHSDIVPGDTGAIHVYVRDVLAGVTRRVSVTTSGWAASRHSFSPSLSHTGRYVAFTSEAIALVSPSTSYRQVYVRDMVTGRTTLVSVAPDGTEADPGSDLGTISGDGRWVVFRSSASDLVDGDTNRAADVFLRDLVRGTTRLVSRAAGGGPADGASLPTGISHDGRVITFHSGATNLLPGGGSGYGQYVWRNGRVSPLAVDADGGPVGAGIDFRVASLAAGGRHVAFTTASSDVLAGDDDDGLFHVFVRDLLTGTTTKVTAGADGDSGLPSISADGRLVTFSSSATNLAPGDADGWSDVHLYDAATGGFRRVSALPDGTQGNGGSSFPAVSADGSAVTFRTEATNLAPGGHTGILWAPVR